jgi:hypothetical protein
LGLTGGKEFFIGKSEGLQEKRVDEGRESQPQWRHLVFVDGSRHGEDFTTLCHNLVCPVENKLARGSRRDTISSAASDEDRKSDVVLERADLLTHRRLRTINPFCSLSEVLSLVDSK